MSARVTIFGQTLSRVTYISAHVRPTDIAEFAAVFGPRADIAVILADIAVASGPYGFVACVDDQPAMAFGVHVNSAVPHLGTAWGFGTDKAWKTIPKVGRFIQTGLIPTLLDAELRRVEVRVLASAKSSVAWLANHMGATFETTLPEYGREGETFHLFSWTQGNFRNVPFPTPPSAGHIAAGSGATAEDGR